ncbi:MAG: hypothetical protein IPH06_08375 [Alphaproteobacteria bacterium]|jgi:hypothetical protein|nr:hypothetical protein [Alphaproteobacteria bacterium]QQS58015.1 MAG: hypothetical protein IPN28_04135 [Alphaproteobacteria bacterium]
MRRLLPLIPVCLLVFVMFAGQAQAQSCPRSNPETEVKKITLKTKYYRGTSAWYLTAWTGHWGKGVVLGLHTGKDGNAPFWADYDAKFEFTPVRNNPNAVCVSVSKIKMKFYIQPVVHIASEYPQESCEFREVLRHEKKHVKVTKEWQKEFTPQLRRELRSIAHKIPASSPVGERQIPATQQMMMNIIKSHLEKFMEKKAVPTLIRRQGKVDDPLEYKLVPERCENWQDYHITAYEPGYEKDDSDDKGEGDDGGEDDSSDDDSESDNNDDTGEIGDLPDYGAN